MRIIRHRVNDLRDLGDLPAGLGAEIDLRSRGSHIVLSHDPFSSGETLEAFLAAWAAGPARGPLILNVKEDNLDGAALGLLEAHGVTDFFFLDLPGPALVRLAIRERVRKVAVRVSRYEPVEAALVFEGLAEWAWLDCFEGEPPRRDVVEALRGKFRLCAVSPELHARPSDEIERFRWLAGHVDAVCTKHPALWRPR